MTHRRIVFVLITLGLALSNCQKKLPVGPMADSLRSYVSAYTQGIISRTSPIQVQFASTTVSAERVGQKAVAGLATLEPATPGEWRWHDRQTLRFYPESMLAAATSYVVGIDMTKLYDNLPTDAQQFQFAVNTRIPYVSFHPHGLNTPNANERGKQVLQGEIRTSDYVEPEALPKLLTATQGGQTLPVSWSHDDKGMIHSFTVSGVARTEKEGQLSVNWNGKAIGAEQSGEQAIDVPAIGDFKATNVTAKGGGEPKLYIHFSDPLDEQQNFSGLVRVEGYNGGMRFVAKGHDLTVYLTDQLAGQQQIQLFSGIRNQYGDASPRASVWEVDFTAPLPQVRLVGHGNIIPSTEGLLFPFEAMGLHAIELEIFKIYHNNIHQYFQVNTYDGSNELYRVGKVVMRKEIDLREVDPNASFDEWHRYALDLKTLFDADPKAMYQVRIGFRKSHANFECGETQTFNYTGNNDWYDEEYYDYNSYYEDNGIMNSWYGLDGYYEGYEWEHRENPCYPGYYNSDRFVARTVLASNMGILVKGNDLNEFKATVTDLRTANPIASAQLRFYSYQQELLGELSTDANGLGTVTLKEQPFLVVGTNSKEQSYLRLDQNEALPLSQFDIEGVAPQDGLKGFLYAERGVWRPGDSVYLHFVLEDEKGVLPQQYPLTFELRDAQGQVREVRKAVQAQGRIYPLHFTTQPDDITGIWTANVRVGNAHFHQNLRIETVKPNRLKVDYAIPEEGIRRNAGDGEVALQSNWLHGAPANGLKTEVETYYSINRSAFPGYKQYFFTDAEVGVDGSTAIIFDGNLDKNGKTDLSIDPGFDAYPGPMYVRLRTRVFEQSGNFSIDNRNYPYFPFDNYVGVKLPTDKYGAPFMEPQKEAKFSFVTVNHQGKPAKGRKIRTELYKVDWHWWWDESRTGGYYNTERNLVSQSSQAITTDDKGQASWAVTVENWGRYLIRACDESSGHCSSGYIYVGRPWYNEQEFSREAAMLVFKADKEKYTKDDLVTLTFPAVQGGRALLSLENGSGILSQQWIDVKAGDNTYSFKTTDAMSPTIYAHLTILQPHGQKNNDLPIRMYGVIPINVEDPSTHLQPVLTVADELEPEKDFTVQLKEGSGRALTYTLAIVDEGLLGLTNFKTPDPWKAFYAREALGVRTWDLYDYVLGTHGTALDRVLSIGGDGDLNPKAQDERANRFKPVVMHLGPFELKAGATATHKLRMPNYVGAVRVMAVVVGDKAYGSAEKSVPVRKPLMVLATLPRVLGVGESFSLPVDVFAMQKPLSNVQVSVKESSGLATVTKATENISFGTTGDKIVRFPITVGNATGVARFTVTATSGSLSASETVEIDVRNPNPVQTQLERFTLEPGKEITLNYQPLGSAGNDREGILEVTNLPPINLEKHLAYLMDYPYGCLEQTISKGFAQLHLDKFVKLTPDELNKINQNIDYTLNRMLRFQMSNGGFSYWPEASVHHPWVSSYAGHFIQAAKAKGHALPANLENAWLRYQRDAARQWNPNFAKQGYVSLSSYQLDQAYRLYTLALAGKPESSAMNQLRESGQLQNTAKWMLAATYQLAGQSDVARQLVSQLSTQVDDYRELAYTYGSSIRDKALILEALVLLKKQDAADETAQQLSVELSSGRWVSTQDIAVSLLAMNNYLGGLPAAEKQYTFNYQQSGHSAVDAGADHPYMRINLTDKAGTVRIKNTSNQKLFGAVIRKGRPLPTQEVASSSMLTMKVSYTDMNGKPLDVTRLEQGQDFMAVVSLTHPGQVPYPYEEMALSQIFPSGWEITNTRFEGIPGTQQNYEYRDFRDDRVFTFFDLYRSNQPASFSVRLTSTYAGRYYLPAVQCGAMYNDKIFASSAGQWVEVISPEPN